MWFPVFAIRASAQRPTSYAVFVSSHPLPFGKTSHPQLNMPLSARLFFSDNLERANSCAFYYAPARYHRCTRCKLRGRLRLRANGTGAPLRRVPMYTRAAVALLTPRACCLPFPAFALCGLAVERRESSHKSASLRLSMRVITRSKSAEE